MNLTHHVRLMAAYNSWMNAKLYEAAGTLSCRGVAAGDLYFGLTLCQLQSLCSHLQSTNKGQQVILDAASGVKLQPERNNHGPLSEASGGSPECEGKSC